MRQADAPHLDFQFFGERENMKLRWFWLLALSLPASADTFDICWTPPTQFVNGDELLEQDLDFYTLYMNDEEVMSFDAIIGTWCVEYVTHVEGTYTAELTVTHINGETSDRSNQHVFTLGPRKPMAPSNVRVVAR